MYVTTIKLTNAKYEKTFKLRSEYYLGEINLARNLVELKNNSEV